MSGPELVIFGPDGRPFTTYAELAARAQQSDARAARLEAQLRALGVEPEA